LKQYAAERTLLVSKKGEGARAELIIKVGIPYLVSRENVAFEVDERTFACEVDIFGLSKPFNEVTYGADLLQALQLSANIDPLINRLSRDYDFYFPTGELYFE